MPMTWPLGRFLTAVTAAGWLLAACQLHAAEAVPRTMVRIGLQAVRQGDAERVHWQSLADGLQRALPAYDFQLRVLPWDALVAAVAQGELQFAVTSPGHYVVLESRHGAARIASQVSDAQGDAAHAVGAAVVVPADSVAQQLPDVRGQRVAAVAPEAFGGYQLAAMQWLRQGLDVQRGDLQPLFTGYPMERVVQAILTGQAQAGVLRLCLLEQMVARGELAPGQLRVLPSADTSAPPPLDCAASTPRYPGWAFAVLPGTRNALADAVLLALLGPAVQAAGSHWAAPADYQAVHGVLRALQVEPYAPALPLDWAHLLWNYRYGVGAALLALLLAVLYHGHVERLVARRTAALTRSLQERDTLAQQVAQAHARIDHMGRLAVLGELSATLAHELSHPLASLSNYVQGLRRRQQRGSLAPAQLAAALDDMEGEAARTLRVLDSVRALARKRVAVMQRTALWPLVGETVALLRAMEGTGATTAPVALSCEAGAQELAVMGDAQQIQQLVLNLVRNAQEVHASSGRSGSPVQVCMRRGAAPGPAGTSNTAGTADSADTVVLSVCDQGPPLEPEALAQCFAPFYTTKPGGLGLGLSISRSIAELHGGRLQARQVAAAGGVCMELVLPVATETSLPATPFAVLENE